VSALPQAAASPNPQPLIVYGLGAIGRRIVDELIDNGLKVERILDRGKRGEIYRDISVEALEDIAPGTLAGRTVMIGLHNHYVNVGHLHGELRAAGAAQVLTPIALRTLVPDSTLDPGYWLDPDYDYASHEDRLAHVRGLLADETSRALFDAILRYRRSGDLADCPVPSLEDEYTPSDLPRFAQPLRIVDCGAFTGVAIHKFLKAGYQIESFVAFEPDPENFATLAGRDFPVARSLCLPMGTWSETKQLRFASEGSMGSHLSDTGDTIVQCVAVDDVLGGEPVNIVKFDVEGAEIETLKGMERLIRGQRPNLLVSVYHTPGHLHEIAELIESWQLDYRFHLRVHEQNTFGVVLYCVQDELLSV